MVDNRKILGFQLEKNHYSPVVLFVFLLPVILAVLSVYHVTLIENYQDVPKTFTEIFIEGNYGYKVTGNGSMDAVLLDANDDLNPNEKKFVPVNKTTLTKSDVG